MKAELRVVPHKVLPGVQVIEVWWGEEFVATVTGTDDYPGIRVISKHLLSPVEARAVLNVVEVRIHSWTGQNRY